MEKLTPLAKGLIAAIAAGSLWAAAHTYRAGSATIGGQLAQEPAIEARQEALEPAIVAATKAPAAASEAKAPPALGSRPVRVALSQWPGHMALVVGAGGLTTQPGSPAA